MSQQNPFAPQAYQPQPEPKKKHTLRTVLIILGSIVIGLPVLVGVISAATGAPAKAPVSVTSQATAPATTQPTVEATTEAPQPSLTSGQEQAIGSAEQYLSFTPFSRKGLIEQLSSDAGEGFSIEQLESSAGEGFTHAQAVYGVTKAGL